MENLRNMAEEARVSREEAQRSVDHAPRLVEWGREELGRIRVEAEAEHEAAQHQREISEEVRRAQASGPCRKSPAAKD